MSGILLLSSTAMLERISPVLLLLLHLFTCLQISHAVPTDCSDTIPTNTVVLFNSRTFNIILQPSNRTRSVLIPGWTTLDEDQQMYLVTGTSSNIPIAWVVITPTDKCSPQYSLCPVGAITPVPNAEMNWILTSYYVTEANNIALRIHCSSISPFPIDCRSAIRAYYYESDENITDVSSLVGQFLPTQAFNGTDNDGFVYFTFTKSKSGFFVGFLGIDYCAVIDRFLFYYFLCPAVDTYEYSLNATPAPNSTLEPTLVPVTDNCPMRSQLNTASPGKCYADGSWELPTQGLSCECVSGAFEQNASCSPCPIGSFKQASGNNTMCLSCPANSNTDGSTGAAECVCDVGWFRGEGEAVTESCGQSPSAVRNLQLERSTVGPVVMWEVPSYLGNRGIELLSYRVSYYPTVDTDDILTYYTTATEYSFDDLLDSSTEYEVIMTSLNPISSLSGVYNSTSLTFLSSFPTLSLSYSDSYLAWEYTLYAVNQYVFQISYADIDTGDILVINVGTNTCTPLSGYARLCNVFISNFDITGLTSISLLDPAGTISMSLNFVLVPSGQGTPYIYIILAAVVIAVILVVLLLFFACSVVCLIVIHKRYNLRKQDAELVPLHARPPSPQYQNPNIYEDLNKAVRALAKEVDPDEIEKESIIGVGEFGDVWKGYLSRHERKIPVALKILKSASTEKNKDDFFKEASVMGQFSHPNVIFLYGVTLKRPIMIVTPFMQNGSLDKYLISHMNNVPFDHLVTLCYGVARGMVYLSLLGFVHRDLAARNILLDKDLTPKISNFEISRQTEEDFYRVQTGGKIPVRWTAPEAILYRKFNTASDMWSFGVLMWEVMSFGQTPYGDTDNFTIIDELQKGYRLPAPDSCPSVIYTLMLSCWNKTPEQRPSFTDIQQSLLQIIDTNRSRPSSASIDATSQNPLNHATLESWLASLNLEGYAVNFRDKGYTQLSSVWHISDTDLFDTGVILEEHRNKIMSSIHRANNQLFALY